ncbi:MAG: nucleotidyltransferase domain-containing protein [Methanobacterium sp.]|jgi:predicted nucleotidyltransferase
MLKRIFTSKTRVKILTFFMINPEKEMFVREISRTINENINAVRRELSNLEQIGLLISKKEGNMKYYSVNKDFPIYEELKSIILKTEGVAKIINNNLSQIGEIKLAFIYGSFASGKANIQSDIDIFLVGELNEDQLIKEILKLEKTLSREINYVLFSADEFNQRINDEDPFVTNVLREPKIMIIGDLNVKKT